jgi:tetratricopeptide (TPR) repeat protein
MIQILWKVLRDYPNWERGPRWSLGLSAFALLGCFLLIVFGPDELRLGAAIGAFGALIVLQAAILYSYRHMVNEYALAQQAYLRSDYDEAIRLMEGRRASGKARWRELTLLSNAYRQRGRLDDALDAAQAALVFAPEDAFPLYAYGRAQLELGDFEAAAETLQKALDARAPREIALDVADARYRAGDAEGAKPALSWLDALPPLDDPQRTLMQAVLHWRVSGGPAPSADQIAAGLPGWLALEARCGNSAYAEALAADREAFTVTND